MCHRWRYGSCWWCCCYGNSVWLLQSQDQSQSVDKHAVVSRRNWSRQFRHRGIRRSRLAHADTASTDLQDLYHRYLSITCRLTSLNSVKFELLSRSWMEWAMCDVFRNEGLWCRRCIWRAATCIFCCWNSTLLSGLWSPLSLSLSQLMTCSHLMLYLITLSDLF